MSTDLELDLPENLEPESSSYEWIEKAGWYHMLIEEVDDEPKDRDGNYHNDGTFTVLFQALEGNVRTNNVFTELGKRMSVKYFAPNGGEHDEKAKENRYQFAVAAGLIDPEKARLARAQGVAQARINLKDATGRQCVARVERGQKRDDGGYFMKIRNDIYPLGHPKVMNVPLDAKAATLVGHKPVESQAHPSAGSKGSAKTHGKAGLNLDSL